MSKGQTHTKVLKSCLKKPENQYCADCRTKGPLWGSATLGVFICIRCAGIHRKLGTHISFVRSVNLDSWKDHHVKNMVKMGNKKVNGMYECHKPSNIRNPTVNSPVEHLERFIRMKYERKVWIRRKGEEISDESDGNESQSPPISPTEDFPKNNFKPNNRRMRKNKISKTRSPSVPKKKIIKKKTIKKTVIPKDSSPPLLVFGGEDESEKVSRTEHMINNLFSTNDTQMKRNNNNNVINQGQFQMNYGNTRVSNQRPNSNVKAPLINNQSREQRILGMFHQQAQRYAPSVNNYYGNPRSLPANSSYRRNNLQQQQQQPLMMNMLRSLPSGQFSDCFQGNVQMKTSYNGSQMKKSVNVNSFF